MRGEVEQHAPQLPARAHRRLDRHRRRAPRRPRSPRRPRAIIDADERSASASGSTGSRASWAATRAASAGLPDTLAALNERRVEGLLVQERFPRAGLRDARLPTSCRPSPATSPAGEELQTARGRDRAGARERARAVGRGGGRAPPSRPGVARLDRRRPALLEPPGRRPRGRGRRRGRGARGRRTGRRGRCWAGSRACARSPSHQLGVHEHGVVADHEHVREQPAVAVARLATDAQAHAPALDEPRG